MKKTKPVSQTPVAVTHDTSKGAGKISVEKKRAGRFAHDLLEACTDQSHSIIIIIYHYPAQTTAREPKGAKKAYRARSTSCSMLRVYPRRVFNYRAPSMIFLCSQC